MGLTPGSQEIAIPGTEIAIPGTELIRNLEGFLTWVAMGLLCDFLHKIPSALLISTPNLDQEPTQVP
jgi:hypothetical protein